MTHLRADLWIIRVHAQEFMKRHGITYQHATPQSISDEWWFWNCQNVPNPLPKGLEILDVDPQKAVGYGLNQSMADAITAQSKENHRGSS